MKNTICALAALILAPVPVLMAGTGKTVKNPIETVKESCITGDLGVSVVSQYVSRGVVLENQGVITQPFVDLYFKLYEGDGFLNKVSLNLGLWSSIHSRHTAVRDSELSEAHSCRASEVIAARVAQLQQVVHHEHAWPA